MCTSWRDVLMLNVRLRQVGQHPESWPISNQIVGVIVVESHHWRHHKRARMMCPRALRMWDNKECLIKKKKKFLLSCFYISFCYITYSDKPCGHRSMALKSLGGVALSWLASICTSKWPSFFIIIILLHMSCVLWHDIIPSFVKAHM